VRIGVTLRSWKAAAFQANDNSWPQT